MKITCIFLDDFLANIYINSGYYPHKVAQEIKDRGHTGVEVKEFETEISNEQLIKFITDNSIQR